MKRFTETTKWTVNPWFRKLPARLKCLWMFLLDNCDAAGVIEPDWELISFQIGETVSAEDLPQFGGRLQRLANGKMWITKFIYFQFGDISPACKAHLPVFKSIDVNGLPYRVLGEEEETVSAPPAGEAAAAGDAAVSPSSSVTEHTLSKGYPKGIQRVQDKDKEEEKDKDKEEDKDKDKDQEKGKEHRSLGAGAKPGAAPAGPPRGAMARATEIVAFYPRREAVREAVEHVARAIREGTPPESIAAGTRAIAEVISKLPSGHLNAYVPSAARFFANRRWEDDPRTWQRAAAKGGGQHAGAMPAAPSLGGRKGTVIRVG